MMETTGEGLIVVLIYSRYINDRIIHVCYCEF
jgi:hypothetical protein